MIGCYSVFFADYHIVTNFSITKKFLKKFFEEEWKKKAVGQRNKIIIQPSVRIFFMLMT